MSELIRNPRVMKKVQDEIRAVAAGNGGDGQRVQPDDMPKLSYLKLVIKETLRLYPPATLLLPRETTRHVKIGGYDVPAGTRVAVNVWAIGRDPASWGESAEEFDPDRFEEGRIHSEVAMMNMEFTLANLLCGFDWALPEGTKAEDLCMEEAGGLTFHRKTPQIGRAHV